MKIITEPTVYVLGRTSLDMDEVEQLLDDEGVSWQNSSENETELLTELSGRLCYMSFGEKQGRKDTAEYLRNIIAMHHGSVLEHAVWNFLITGVSRSFTHELVRHRSGTAFSQLSQRYVDESETSFVVPPLIQEAGAMSERAFLTSVECSLIDYKHIVGRLDKYLSDKYPHLTQTARRKRAREAARSVLPNATETKIVFSANARALRHIIELRGSEHADAEIRAVALKLLEIMKTEAPAIFEDMYETNGHVAASHSKV